MHDNVHVLTPALDHERYVTPLLDPSKAVDNIRIYAPPDDHPFPESAVRRLQKELTDSPLENDFETIEIDPNPLSKAVQELYGDFLAELQNGNTLHINVNGGSHQIGSVAAIAATYLIMDVSESPESMDAESVSNVRDNIILYGTEPAEDYTDRLLAASEEITGISSTISDLKKHADELAERVERDRHTANEVTTLLDLEFDEVADSLRSAPEFSDFFDSVSKLFDGIETTVEGMNELAQNEELQNSGFADILGIEGVTDLMNEVQEDAEPVQPKDLMKYFENRLERIQKILFLAQRVEGAQPDEIEGGKTIFEIVASKGVAGGTRGISPESNSRLQHSFLEYPLPLQHDLNDKQRVLLYVLSEFGPADSVQQLIKRVIHECIKHASDTGSDLPDTTLVDTLRTDPDPDDYPEDILDSINSTVQYNIGKLEGKGYVRRKNEPGQKEKPVEFTRAGKTYASTQRLNQARIESDFKSLEKKIVKSLQE